jgi:hypothetical protein
MKPSVMSSSNITSSFRSQSYFTTVSQCLGVDPTLGLVARLLPIGRLLSESCGIVFEAPPLTRGQFYSFQRNHSMLAK